MTLKIILSSFAALAILAAALPTLKAMTGRGENEAARLVNAADRAENQAQAVGRSYQALIPGRPPETPTRASPPASAPNIAPASAGATPPIASLLKETSTDAYHWPTPPPDPAASPSPTQPPAPAAAHSPTPTPREHAIGNALFAIREMEDARKPGIPPTPYIQAIEALQAEWNPLYRTAMQELERLELYITSAGQSLADYIELQKTLTDQIHDPETRIKEAKDDGAEARAWQEWLITAETTLAKAQEIGKKLEDIDIVITKTALSAQASLLFAELPELPGYLMDLETQMERFHTETGEIRREFAPATRK